MVGSAVETMVWSRAARNIPSITPRKTSRTRPWFSPAGAPSAVLAVACCWAIDPSAAWWTDHQVSSGAGSLPALGAERATPRGRHVLRVPHPELLDAVEPGRAQPPGLAGQPDVGDDVGDGVEDQVQLQPGQVGAQAEVRPAAAEAQVRVGVAEDVELLGAVEDLGVVVGRAVEDPDALARGDLHPAELGVLGGGALEGH